MEQSLASPERGEGRKDRCAVSMAHRMSKDADRGSGGIGGVGMERSMNQKAEHVTKSASLALALARGVGAPVDRGLWLPRNQQ